MGRQGAIAILRRLARDRRGATVVEFALTAPAFLMLLLGIIEIGVLAMMSANFNAAVSTVARQLRTGQDDGPQSAAEFKAKICAHMADSAASCLARLAISVAPVGRFSDAAGDFAELPDAAAGGGDPFVHGAPNQVMVVTATYRWPFVVPFAEEAFPRADGVHVLIASRFAFKNEPYL